MMAVTRCDRCFLKLILPGLLAVGLLSGCDQGKPQAAPAPEAKPPETGCEEPGGEERSAEAPKELVGKDWPMFGGSPSRNMVNLVEKGLPDGWDIKKKTNVKWVAKLGNVSYGGPVVAGGRVYVGTNNERPRDPKVKGDKGVLMCFRESDGQFLWQMVHDKLPEPNENDFPQQGIASTPAVEGDRVYYVSNACEVVCLDVGKPDAKEPKVAWRLDMVKEFKVYPHFLANCSPLVAGDLVFVVTGNGVDTEKFQVQEPDAPSFLAIDKNTGRVVWKDNSPGKNILDGQWSNPAYAEVKGVPQVIFPGGDGWVRGFEPKTGRLLWKFDCNPKDAVAKVGGRGTRNNILATPVVYDDKVYIATGQNPDYGFGVGHLWCIDAAKEPKNKDKDLSPAKDNFDPKAPENKDSGLVWHYGGPVVPKPKQGRDVVFGRTLSTCAAHDGLLYVAEYEGFLHCFDAKTGQKHWSYDFKTTIWASPYWVDGKVYLGTEDGDMYVFAAGKELKDPEKIEMEGMKGTPVAAHGVLYVQTDNNLFAIAKK